MLARWHLFAVILAILKTMTTTKNQKKLVSYFMLAVLGVILTVNTFLTMWIITATGLGIVSYSASKTVTVKFHLRFIYV